MGAMSRLTKQRDLVFTNHPSKQTNKQTKTTTEEKSTLDPTLNLLVINCGVKLDFLSYFIFTYLCGGRVCRGERKTCWTWFFPFMWLLGTELMSGLMTSALPQGALSLVPLPPFMLPELETKASRGVSSSFSPPEP